jgi:hypothetical protein
VVGVTFDVQGNPICCELMPGNTAYFTTLVPVMERLRRRFGLRRLTAMADRGMVSAKPPWRPSRAASPRWGYMRVENSHRNPRPDRRRKTPVCLPNVFVGSSTNTSALSAG